MAQPAGAAVAKLVHLSLMTGIVVIAGVAWFAAPGREAIHRSGAIFFPGLLGLAAADFAIAAALGSRLPPASDAEAEGWWRANFPRVLAVWALIEVPALAGAGLYLATGEARGLIVAAAALLLLLYFAPSRLADDAR